MNKQKLFKIEYFLQQMRVLLSGFHSKLGTYPEGLHIPCLI